MTPSNDSAEVPRPIFLVGSERSGSTLLRLMLDHHPDLAFLPEAQYLVDLVGDDGSLPSIPEYRAWLAVHRGFPKTGFEVPDTDDYNEIVRSFLEQRRQRDGKQLVGATVHSRFNRLRLIWPEARYVYLFRDGRDVARSRVQIGWEGNTWAAFKEWVKTIELWDRTKAHLDPADWISVQYEKLVDGAEAELRRICEFLGLEYSSAMFDYAQTSTYDLPRSGLAQQWRSKIPPVELQRMEWLAGDRLVELGYELSGLDPHEVGAFEELRLRAHDKYTRTRFRWRRYGRALWLAGVISRRTGPRSWRDSVQMRINEIDRQFLK